MIKEFLMSDVKLTDSYCSNAFEKEIAYLKSYDCDRLLSFFRSTKGLTPKAESYPGWEDSEIRGHTMGHYLTALAQAHSNTKDSTIYERLQYLIDELSLCQFENGYLSAFPEEFFDRLENQQPVWVPWYTMHKIIAGLILVCKLTNISKAHDIVSKLGDWVYKRTDKWTLETQARVLSIEYGGMNDCMYELYKLTKKEIHRLAAHKFDEIDLFTQIHDGKDVLNNRHANTTIPKFLGALNRYFVYGENEKFYLDAAKAFWDIVISDHSYITGGNSEWEHFGEPNILDAERTNTNCETCNTYNMLKLSRGLFQLTGDKKYADFYENTFINAILSSQNPETGMTTYFQPMATGYFKVYSSAFEHFWCCTGTGMENFSKLNDSLYFYDNDNIYVNMYLSSEVNWSDKKVKITQNSDIPTEDTAKFTINVENDTEFVLSLRLPKWSKETSIKVNGKKLDFKTINGYAAIKRKWNNNDNVEIRFVIEAAFAELPDNKNAVAFYYGPVVLSAALGKEKLEESLTGVIVKIPSKHVEIKDYITIKDIDTWKRNFKENFVRVSDKLEFKLKGTDEDNHLLFTPHYRQYTERYGIYWTLVEEGSEELQKYILEKKQADLIAAAEIDSVQAGNDQYELSHHIQGHETEAGNREGYHYRLAKPNGWFSYEMKVVNTEDTYLQISYIPAGCQKGFDILVNDTLLVHEAINGAVWNKLVTKTYLIPKEFIGNKNLVIVKFKAAHNEVSASIADLLRTTKKYDKLV
ncbi:beta-L-arabinofuranosidase domain-containing protein [Clostridium oryzae]|uniref:Non-reducing end beta-L-arabinofuranosidase n=1 Tax=Clostridium oryzae TaxID=1450648 RepID=A0A1V4ICK0_9CLOT|nr:beta-L-arabinofuranosidase domain-containing protein [Clostridium oryzae]OPJ57732.1 Non-reducing end beta-L-arabinofuranosidase [Clostridium oryzae]